MIAAYAVVSASMIAELENKVTEMIIGGWQPFGNLQVVPGLNLTGPFYQTMVHWDVEDKS